MYADMWCGESTGTLAQFDLARRTGLTVGLAKEVRLIKVKI